MGKFIHLRSDKFVILPGEDDEIVNEGMYGKALAEYLQRELTELGYNVPFICAEDWGWWVELSLDPMRSGVLIHAVPETSDPIEYLCTDGFKGDRKWSWSKLRFIDTRPLADTLLNDLLAIFERDSEVEILGVLDDVPY